MSTIKEDPWLIPEYGMTRTTINGEVLKVQFVKIRRNKPPVVYYTIQSPTVPLK